MAEKVVRSKYIRTVKQQMHFLLLFSQIGVVIIILLIFSTDS
jgi:hypothetical protein